MDMRAFEDLKHMLCREVKEITDKGELNAGGLDTVHKLTDTIKNIDKIMMLEEGGEGYSQRRDGDRNSRNREGYSRGGNWEARGRFGHSYDEGGNSYRNRDRMGRYSRDDGRHEMIGELEDLMKDATGRDKEVIRRAVDELKNA